MDDHAVSFLYFWFKRERERESVTRDTCSHLMEHGRFDQGEVRNFYLRGPSCSTNIFIKTTSHIHIYTCFFIIYTFFYLISYIYIYTHTPKKKKSLIFSIKIMFDGNFSWNKIHFYHFYSEILKKCHFRYKLSNFILK